MDAGLAAHGHGWPIAAGPWSRTGARECRAQARHRTKGARAFGYLALFQVTRRKGETNRSRNRRNGYVHQQKIRRRSDRHREQAHSHSLNRVHQGNTHRLSDRHRRQASSHSLIRGQQGKMRRLSRRHREQAHSYSLIRVHQGILIWLSGRHRWQASSHNLILVIPSNSSVMRPPSRTRFALHLQRNARLPPPPDDRHQKPIATKYYIRHITSVINTALHR